MTESPWDVTAADLRARTASASPTPGGGSVVAADGPPTAAGDAVDALGVCVLRAARRGRARPRRQLPIASTPIESTPIASNPEESR